MASSNPGSTEAALISSPLIDFAFVQWEEDEESGIMSLLITRRWHLNSYSAVSTCATSTLKLARSFWNADRPAAWRHHTDDIITCLCGLEDCEVSSGPNVCQRIHCQCCYVMLCYTFVLFVWFTSSAQPKHHLSPNAVTLGTQLVSE